MVPRAPAATEPPRPTDAELAILAVLWRIGKSTVREVHDELMRYEAEPTGYTTTLKMLQIMHAKGLVTRDDSERAHVFAPARSKRDTQAQLLGDLTRRVFGDSPTELVLHALGSTKRADALELEKIRALLDGIEPKGRR